MFKKVICRIVNILSIFIILAALLILLSVVLTKPGRAPSVFGYSAFRVMSGSMEPAVPEQSLIVVRRADPEEIRVGDVITFYSDDPDLDGAVNTHRVTAIEAGEDGVIHYTTKGDANLVEDKYPVDSRSLIGVMLFSSTALGTLVRLLANPLVFIPLILVPLVLILVLNLIKTFRLAGEAVRAEEEKALREALERLQREREEKNAPTQTQEDLTGES